MRSKEQLISAYHNLCITGRYFMLVFEPEKDGVDITAYREWYDLDRQPRIEPFGMMEYHEDSPTGLSFMAVWDIWSYGEGQEVYFDYIYHGM